MSARLRRAGVGLLAWLAVLAWALAACAAGLPAPTRPTASPTTPTSAAEPTFTPAASFTVAPPPSLAPSPTPSPAPPMPSPSPATAVSPTPPYSAQALLAEVRFTPWDHVMAVAWSPDGSLLAAAAGSQVYIYRYPGLERLAALNVGVRSSQVVFDPLAPPGSPALAIAVRDGTLQFWDVLSGERRASWAAHRKSANSLAFSPDGARLASTGNDAMVRLWDLGVLRASGEPPGAAAAEMIGGAVAVPAVRFSPDGALLASVDLGAVRLRDPQTQRLVETLRAGESIFNIEFNPDGKTLAAAELDNQVEIWQVGSGAAAASLSAPFSGGGRPFFWALAYDPAGARLAAGSSTGEVSIWQVQSGERQQTFRAHALAVAALAFSPDGRVLATGGLDGVLRLWQP